MKTKILSLVAVFIISSSILSAAGFNSIHTSDGVNIIAVGNDGLIFRSVNGGNSWSSYIYLTADMKGVCTYGNNVWIATENGDIYKTGKTVSPIVTYNIGENFAVNSICFVNDNTGYLCGDGGRIYKSLNGGVNWTAINTGIVNVKLNSISFIDEMKGVVAGENGTIYTTENGGTTWTVQVSGTTRNLLKAKYFTDGITVVGEYGTIISKPLSGSWTSVNTRTDSDIRSITGTEINKARVCGGGGFIRNNLNNRANFFNFEINPMLANLVDIFYYNDNLGFAVSSMNNAIIRTTNGGLSWDLPSGTSTAFNWVQKSPNGSGIGNNLCMHPKDRNSAYVVYGNKVYVSRDRGESWTQIATISIGSRAHSFYVSPVDTNIWVCAIESSPDRVVRSTDYGLTWNTIIQYDFSSYGQPLEMDQNNPSVFYYAPTNTSGTGLFKSTDNGATFNLVAPYGISSVGSPCDLVVMWDSSDVLFMGDDGAEIYKTTNGGLNWTMVKPGTSSEIPSMCNSVFDQSICYATTWGGTQVYRTVNHGDAWSIVSNNSGSGWGSDLCHEDPNVVLTGNYGSQAYLTTNGGAQFFNINNGLSGAGAGIMVPERGWMLNMQTGSLFKLNIVYSVITSANENILTTSVPESFELYQNYPNPFNPETKIKYSLPNSGSITLKVYNGIGKEIETLSEGFKSAGTYEVNFDATSLASGIYFYKLTAEGVTHTKKMTLLK